MDADRHVYQGPAPCPTAPQLNASTASTSTATSPRHALTMTRTTPNGAQRATRHHADDAVIPPTIGATVVSIESDGIVVTFSDAQQPGPRRNHSGFIE